MPVTLTIGHVLLLVAALDLALALVFALGASRNSGHGRGTPGYARARTARRSAVYAFASALVFALLALTPLGGIVIG